MDPLPFDPTVAALDIETFGACERTHHNHLLPPQRTFHPRRMIETDGCPPSHLALTCALTLPRRDPRCPSSSTNIWTGSHLAALEPGPTLIFNLWDPAHVRCLRAWLFHLDTLIGMNIKFDLKVLRHFSSLLRTALPPRRHFLIDASILNYLHNETKSERSLKDIGPLFLIYAYATTLKEGKRFPHPVDPKFRSYQAEDPHNTLLACSTLARHTLKKFPPPSPKLSPFCLSFYNRTIWTCLLMEETGIPFSLPRIRRLHSFLTHRVSHLTAYTSSLGLTLTGKGSATSKLSLLTSLTAELESSGIPILSNPLLTLTEKRRTLSTSSANIDLILSHLPPTHEKVPVLRAWQTLERHQKLLSTYTFPLLHHKRSQRKNQPPDRSSLILPISPTRGLTYPDWYPTPSSVKDGSGSDGGTVQGRVTCKNPAAQTFPAIIKSCIRSRYPHGSILSIDLSQIELRVAALLSGEPSLLTAYRNNEDIHGRRAISAWSAPTLLERYPDLASLPPDKWKTNRFFDRRERQVGKRLNFADLFRAGAAKMQLSVYDDIGELFPLHFFQAIVDSRPALRPRLYEWQSRLIHETHSRGYLMIPLTGQSRYFMGGTKFDENEIVNCPVQTTAGNLMLELQSAISARLPDPLTPGPHIRLFQNTYDALYFDVPPGKSPTLLAIIREEFDRLSTPEGYWGMLQEWTGNTCPIKYDVSEH